MIASTFGVHTTRHRRLTRGALACALTGLLVLGVGCATFRGDIPVQAHVTGADHISPRNADGIQDALEVSVSVSAPYEDMVVGGYSFTVRDDTGAAVRTIGHAAPALTVPSGLSWDGKNDTGGYVADGAYTWAFEVRDIRGNTGRNEGSTVVVDNTPPSLAMTLPYDTFSPNGDGERDVLAIDSSGATVEDSWRAELRGNDGSVVRTMSWAGTPERLTWDGTDDSGLPVADGLYVYAVWSRDSAGNSGTFTTPAITVDTRTYGVQLALSADILSPNDDGAHDSVDLLPSAVSPEPSVSWTITVHGQSPARRTLSGAGSPPERLVFDGRDDGGAPLPDGPYVATLVTLYRNGAAPEAVTPAFVVDTRAPQVDVAVDQTVFSPDGDGRRDRLTIHQASSGDDTWSGRITDAVGRVVWTGSWQGRVADVVFDGRDAGGWALQDGVYTYTVESTDAAGNTTVLALPVRIDTRHVTATLTASVSAVSPNGDGDSDTVDLDLRTEPQDGIEHWELRLYDPVGSPAGVIPAEPGAALPARLRWDGTLPGRGVVEGLVTAELYVRYEWGAVARVELNVDVDVTAPVLTLAVTPEHFTPDGDGVDDLLSIRLDAVDRNGIGSWTATLLDPTALVFYQWSGTGIPSKPTTWDGRSVTGEWVQSSEDYTLAVEAADGLGNRGSATARIPIDILVLREGDGLRIVTTGIAFREYAADYLGVPAPRAEANLRTLDRLAAVLLRYSGHTIQVVGHELNVWEDDVIRAKDEEVNVLQPLSRDRANAVRQALVERNIPADRMTSVGAGSTQPVVPHSDLKNRWKNRRIELILEPMGGGDPGA